MKDFEVLEVDREVESSNLDSFPEEGKLLSVKPTRDVSMSEMERLFKTLHTIKTETQLFKGTRNASEACGLEIWYEKGKFEFVFYVPNKEQERHYRKQIVGHFDNISIQEKVDSKFLSINEGDYISGGRFHLNNHFFEPINHDGFTHSDPYKPILSEIDSRDDKKAMLQILYKPAMDDWTETPFNNVSEYAEKRKNGTKTVKKFGLFPVQKEFSQEDKDVAKAIEKQKSDLGFHVNIRLLLVSPSDGEKLEQEARNVEHQISREYRRKNGQTFDIQPASNKEELIDIVDLMSNRKEHTMNKAEGRKIYIKTILNKIPIVGRFINDIYKTRMIMTVPELVSVCHLPKPDLLETIVGSDDVIKSGSVPEGATKHDEVSENEKEQIQKGDRQ